LNLKQLIKQIYKKCRAIVWSYIDDRKKKSFLRKIPTLKPLESHNEPQYIVSLTSYGKRITTTAPYAIISLFDQTIQPDKIVLWVGENDKDKVGKELKSLEEKGLEIRYCEDIRSYTKLIPSLKAFPEDNIITADDDKYYPHNWFEPLITEHKNHPHKIICHRVRTIKVDENCNVLPYSRRSLPDLPSDTNNKQISPPFSRFDLFPLGVGGILYPPKALDKQVLDKDLFMKLAPMADDIWFWAMALINKEYNGEESPYVKIDHHQRLQSVDRASQNDGNALRNYNVSQNGNDKQLKAVIEYFPQLKEILLKIKTNSI
jgi:hypothetical protein